MSKVQINTKNAQFREDFSSLEKREQKALAGTLQKISQLSWQQVYQDKGLKWEKIKQKDVFSFRFSQKYRATALREGDFLRLLALHVDHDSAYH